MNKMKICKIWFSDYPWDIRVEKICKTLIQNGHEVHLVCRNNKMKPLIEIYRGIKIHRLPFITKKCKFLNKLIGFPVFFNPLWIYIINKCIRQNCIDVIIVRDLPLALSAIIIGKLNQIPVIFDMAECYPEMLRAIWKYEPFKFLNIIIRNPLLGDLLEKVSVKCADHIFVMVGESENRLIEKMKCSKNKITIVSNTPMHHHFQDTKAEQYLTFNNDDDSLKLIFIGILDHFRGLDILIKSLHFCIESGMRATLKIIGTGKAEKNLRRLTRKLGIEKNVVFEGWVMNKLIYGFISSSDICLIPHYYCSHWNNTVPNKLFDYMAAKKPVLASNVKPIKRIVENEKCGLVYVNYDYESFYMCILKLKNKNLRIKMGENGHKAVIEKYNWYTDSRRMLNVLKRFSKEGEPYKDLT